MAYLKLGESEVERATCSQVNEGPYSSQILQEYEVAADKGAFEFWNQGANNETLII